MNPSSLPPETLVDREALRRRIDAELEQLGPIDLSSWMMGLANPPSTPPTAEEIETWATPLEVESRLGRLLWKENARLKDGQCFHVLNPDSQLMAVIKPDTEAVYIKERVVNVNGMKGWQLQRRPAAAFNAPPGYRRTTITATLWRFALFDGEGSKALPKRYLHVPLALRQLPNVARDLVPVRQVKLMQLLSRQACTFAELRTLTQLSDEQLSRDLAALYLTRSLRLGGPGGPQVVAASA